MWFLQNQEKSKKVFVLSDLSFSVFDKNHLEWRGKGGKFFVVFCLFLPKISIFWYKIHLFLNSSTSIHLLLALETKFKSYDLILAIIAKSAPKSLFSNLSLFTEQVSSVNPNLFFPCQILDLNTFNNRYAV